MSVSAIGTSITAPSPGDRASVERGDDGERGGEPRHLVADRAGDVLRLAGHPFLLRRQPGHGLGDVVVRRKVGVGTIGSEAADRAVHELGVIGAQRVGVGTALGERIRAHVRHEDVGAVGERLERAPAVVGREIEHDAALVPIAVEEHRAHATVDVRTEMPGDVAGR